MNTPPADALTERVERLERHCSLLQRSNRRWKGTALILILGGMVASVAGAWKEDGPKLVQVQELQTERLILHDKQGHRCASLGLVSQRSGRLMLMDGDEKIRLSMMVGARHNVPFSQGSGGEGTIHGIADSGGRKIGHCLS